MKQLIVFSGLPGSGKSTVAEAVARELGLLVVSVDPIEAAMWRNGLSKEETGIAAYEQAATIVEAQLKLGLSVVVDAVNPVEAPRRKWRELAKAYDAKLSIIEVICSDAKVHRQRVEARRRNIPGMPEVTWERVEQRRVEYEPWQDEHLILDSIKSVADLQAQVITYLKG